MSCEQVLPQFQLETIQTCKHLVINVYQETDIISAITQFVENGDDDNVGEEEKKGKNGSVRSDHPPSKSISTMLRAIKTIREIEIFTKGLVRKINLKEIICLMLIGNQVRMVEVMGRVVMGVEGRRGRSTKPSQHQHMKRIHTPPSSPG